MNWRYALLSIGIFLGVAIPAMAQTSGSSTYLFPIFVDGTTGSGSAAMTYKSTVQILPIATTTPSMVCTFTQTQTDTSFVGISGTQYLANIYSTAQNYAASTQVILNAAQPLEVLQSPGSEPLKTGFASLSCPQPVQTQVTISLYNASGAKIGETTVLPATSGASFEFVLDRRTGVRLGISLVNNSSVVGNFTLIARDEYGHIVDEAVNQVNYYSQMSFFADDPQYLTSLPPDFYGTVEVVGVSGGTNYAVGLQYTGSLFSILTPTVRNSPIPGF